MVNVGGRLSNCGKKSRSPFCQPRWGCALKPKVERARATLGKSSICSPTSKRLCKENEVGTTSLRLKRIAHLTQGRLSWNRANLGLRGKTSLRFLDGTASLCFPGFFQGSLQIQ